jgi:hypothetical protein
MFNESSKKIFFTFPIREREVGQKKCMQGFYTLEKQGKSIGKTHRFEMNN